MVGAMPARVLIALAAGLALADASIVTLALPPILVDLDTTVEGVAAVVGIYTAVLAVGLLPAAALERRVSARFGGPPASPCSRSPARCAARSTTSGRC